MTDQTRGWSRSLVVLATILLLGLLSLPSLRAVSAQEEDAATVLASAAEAMGEVQSFHFELSTPRGETRFAENLTLLGLSGDVQRPDRFQAVALVDATIAQMELTVIGIGTTAWISDPLSADGSYIELDLNPEAFGEGPSITDLANPDRLLLTAVEAIEQPVIAGQDEIDGVLTTRINGFATFDPLQDAGLAVSPTAESPLLGQQVQVAVWIDEEYRVRQLDVYGPLLAVEAPNTVRRLNLSAFDEPVEILPPELITTPPSG